MRTTTDRFLDLFDGQPSRELTTTEWHELAKTELTPLGIQLMQVFCVGDREDEEDVPRFEGIRQYPAQTVFLMRWIASYSVSLASELSDSQSQTLQEIAGVRNLQSFWSVDSPAALEAFVRKLDQFFGKPCDELDLSAQGRRNIAAAMRGWDHHLRDDLVTLSVPSLSGIKTERQLDFGVLQFSSATVLIARWLDQRLWENPEFGEYSISFAEPADVETVARLNGIEGVHQDRALRWKVDSREAMILVLGALHERFGDWRCEIALSQCDRDGIVSAARNWSDLVYERFVDKFKH